VFFFYFSFYFSFLFFLFRKGSAKSPSKSTSTAAMLRHTHDWTVKEVESWLSVLPDGLDTYASLFARHHINGKVGRPPIIAAESMTYLCASPSMQRLLKLNEEIMRVQLGIESYGHRAELMVRH
jgi:hypothetical protein